MRIDSYSFGAIRIDGVEYSHDVILYREHATSPWWREAGSHVFAPPDLEQLIESGPETVVLGTGYFGRVRVQDDTVSAFADQGTKVVVEKTGRAVEEYNRLVDEGVDVAAALHLTC